MTGTSRVPRSRESRLFAAEIPDPSMHELMLICTIFDAQEGLLLRTTITVDDELYQRALDLADPGMDKADLFREAIIRARRPSAEDEDDSTSTSGIGSPALGCRARGFVGLGCAFPQIQRLTSVTIGDRPGVVSSANRVGTRLRDAPGPT